MKRPNYGIDSPAIVNGLLTLSIACFATGLIYQHILGLRSRWILWPAGAYLLCGTLGMLHYSKIGKLRMRERLLDGIDWRGYEQVLDLGCGRGLFLIGAARRLTRGGKAVGADVWVRGAIANNRAEAVLENAILEGVADRVSVKMGDARELPFEDASFDVVVSNFVLHEVKTSQDREKILREVLRVLKPGGRFLLVDFIFTHECAATLRQSGASNTERLRIGRLSFWITAVLSFGTNRLYQIKGTKNPC